MWMSRFIACGTKALTPHGNPMCRQSDLNAYRVFDQPLEPQFVYWADHLVLGAV